MKYFFLLLMLGWSNYSFCQLNAGIEVQVYPTGFIPGIHLEYAVGAQSSLQGRLGYNVVRHRDLGVQEEERGGGFGGTLGYRYYFNDQRNRWMIGARSDVWWNEVDWKNNIGLANEVSGTTNVTVLQPTAEVGYVFQLKNDVVFFPTLSLGAEINVKTAGAEVGQGAILLFGISLAKRL